MRGAGPPAPASERPAEHGSAPSPAVSIDELAYIGPVEGMRPNVRRREAIAGRALGIADASSAAVALALSITVLGDDHLRATTLLALPIVVIVSKVLGLYDRDDNRLSRRTLDEAPALFSAATAYTLLIWLLEPQLVVGDLGRAQVVGLWAVLLICMMLARASARVTAARISPPERCLLIGDAAAARRLRARLAGDSHVRAELVGYVAGASTEPDSPWTNADLQVLQAHTAKLDVDRIIIAGTSDTDQMLDLIRSVKALGVKVSVLPRLFEVIGSTVEFDYVDGMTLLGVREFGLSRSSRAVKRVFDLIAALAGLVFTSPLIALIALIALKIKLDSSGPVFFRQTRMGRDGRSFEVLKFRSMCYGADALKAKLAHLNETEGLFKIADDPRITRFGRLLRRTSLDELPQLFNVLRGEMSLVGPRPLVLDDDELIRAGIAGGST